jgi:hypothetical protein
MVVRQADPSADQPRRLTIHGWAPTKAPLRSSGPEDGEEELNMTRLLLVVAAVVGLGAVLARSVVPDVTRYLRIRRM